MRKTLIALMFAAALPTVAMAMPQDGGPMDGPAYGHDQHHGKGGFQKLDLTKEQRQQIRKLVGEQRHDRKAIAIKYLEKLSPADKAAFKGELDAAHQKTQGQIRALLTPEQQKTFDEMQKKQAERRAEWTEFKAWKAQQAQKAQ
ncbi:MULTISPECIES: Spy/CpxP family protein refolding chaperone [Pseudomonas]|uniref:LTXXQ domain protein n=1 Tax=Pseudomonas gingeri TaxID=117681 RepID=A0A7Y7WQ56_9PSED|nr:MULTISPECIES: Spy/CpxP family protein refolding chaperone [Pseudomonas]MPQ67423.1 LTXXQ domain protein [Pseudomonas sp. MWU12-2323]NWB85327.1 LTXXQ domain protein [Pseudomonas gingeri]RBH59547.1 LTXXQ domain protein [Pseudomonas sp. MWU13-2860]